MKKPFLSLIALALATGCVDFLADDPSVTGMVGRWEATTIDAIVTESLSESGFPIGLIPIPRFDFRDDGTFDATNIPYSTDYRKAGLFSGSGRWKIKDSRSGNDSVNWELMIYPDDVMIESHYELHGTLESIYFTQAFDLDYDVGITFSRP